MSREALAASVGRRRPQAAKLDELSRRAHDGDPQPGRYHTRLRSPVMARCTATRDDEHAVSTVIAGPWRFSV